MAAGLQQQQRQQQRQQQGVLQVGEDRVGLAGVRVGLIEGLAGVAEGCTVRCTYVQRAHAAMQGAWGVVAVARFA